MAVITLSRKATAADGRRLRALANAREIFAARGYDGLQLDLVARAAGVSRSWLYSTFPDRKALLIALIERDVDDFVDRLAHLIVPGLDLDQMLSDGLNLFLTFVEERRAEYLMLFGQAGRLEPEVALRLRDLRDRLATAYVVLFRPAVERAGGRWPTDEEARLVAHAMLALAEGAVQAWLTDPRLARDRLQATVVAMMHRALLGSDPTRRNPIGD